MTEWLKNQKALATPANENDPYSDPVSAAAAERDRFRQALEQIGREFYSSEFTSHAYAIRACEIAEAALGYLCDPLAAVRPPRADEER